MTDPNLLATAAAAVNALSPYLLEAAKGAAGRASEDAYAGVKKLLGWLKQKLTSEGRKALELVEADPANTDKQAALRVTLSEVLEADSNLFRELTSLLKSVPRPSSNQHMTQIGDANTGAQAAGQNINVSIGGKN